MGEKLSKAGGQSGAQRVPTFFNGRGLEDQLGDFVIQKYLGAGGYGVVVLVAQAYNKGKALPTEQQSLFALKLQSTASGSETLSKAGAKLASRQELAQRESTIYQSIWNEKDEQGVYGHPFIVQLLFSASWPQGKDCELHDGHKVTFTCPSGQPIQTFNLALAMEYCAMGSLDIFIKKEEVGMRNGMDDKDDESLRRWHRLTRLFAAQMLSGLKFLHTRSSPIIYRDLKPENVFLTGSMDNPCIKLGDFGFSKFLSADDPPASIAGTPYFASPEMVDLIKGRIKEVTTTTDIFSFGKVLFVLAKGCDPHQGQSGMEWMAAHEQQLRVTGPLMGELTQKKSAGPEIAHLIKHSLEKDGAKREGAGGLMKYPAFQQFQSPTGVPLKAIDWTELCQIESSGGAGARR